MAKPGTAATASAHTNTAVATIILRSFMNIPLRGLTSRLTSFNRAVLPSFPEEQPYPGSKLPYLLLKPTSTADEIQTKPSKQLLPASRPSKPAFHAIASPPQSLRRPAPYRPRSVSALQFFRPGSCALAAVLCLRFLISVQSQGMPGAEPQGFVSESPRRLHVARQERGLQICPSRFQLWSRALWMWRLVRESVEAPPCRVRRLTSFPDRDPCALSGHASSNPTTPFPTPDIAI